MILGLRTAIYPAPDLAAAAQWYARLLGQAPYFDQPFYVGFNVGGFWPALFGSVVYSVISWALSAVFLSAKGK